MASNENLSQHRFLLNNGSGEIPALGFGTSLSDNKKTEAAVKTAVEVGFRHLDAAERYRNEAQVGAALTELFADGTVRREDLFVTTKLWNNNHRPERVKPALQASLDRLGLDAVDRTWCTLRSRSSLAMTKILATRRALFLRRRRHVSGNMGRDGGPCRRGTVASDRPVRYRRRKHPEDRRYRPNQAGGRGGRVAPLSPAMGTP